MEKEPKIGKSLEGDNAIPEFEKKEPKIELPEEPEEPQVELSEKPGDVETWEDEGGAVKSDAENPEEVYETAGLLPVTEIEQPQVFRSWQEIIEQAKTEFPENIKAIIDKKSQKKTLKPAEQSLFDKFVRNWFMETFGIVPKAGHPIKKEPLSEEETAERKKKAEEESKIKEEQQRLNKEANRKRYEELRKQKEGKASETLLNLASLKREKMTHLHAALGNLDTGEPVEEFRDESRRTVYFDEENQRYFVEDDGVKRTVGLGDIMSDYAWGIQYVPDGEMIEPAYRAIAKRILVNEARRDLEKIYNKELVTREPYRGMAMYPLSKIINKLKIETKQKERERIITNGSGFFAEVSIRELLSRVASNYNLDFVVSRANVQEDADFKYDFKIRIKRRIRGVSVDSRSSIKSVGFQLKTNVKRRGVTVGQYPKGKQGEVDEVLILKAPGKDFVAALKMWLQNQEPSGGPEQFLSRDLKIRLLKEATKGLVEIEDEEIERIFPKGESPVIEQNEKAA